MINQGKYGRRKFFLGRMFFCLLKVLFLLSTLKFIIKGARKHNEMIKALDTCLRSQKGNARSKDGKTVKIVNCFYNTNAL